jgi:hypothetical protein
MALRIREFSDLFAAEFYLRGGIRGGRQVVNASGVVQNLHGKTLIFNVPSGTVTFDETAGAAGLGGGLTLQEITAQIQAVHAGLQVSLRDKILNIIEATPTNGVDLDKDGTANTLFGFSGASDNVGDVISAPGGTAPTLVGIWGKTNNDGYMVIIDEA